VFLLKSKDQFETVDALESFDAHYVRPYGYKINYVRFDRGESKSNLMVQLLKKIGSTFEYSPTGDHQANSIAERYIQTIDNDQHCWRFLHRSVVALHIVLIQIVKVPFKSFIRDLLTYPIFDLLVVVHMSEFFDLLVVVHMSELLKVNRLNIAVHLVNS
jgi:hypothetical protein